MAASLPWCMPSIWFNVGFLSSCLSACRQIGRLYLYVSVFLSWLKVQGQKNQQDKAPGFEHQASFSRVIANPLSEENLPLEVCICVSFCLISYPPEWREPTASDCCCPLLPII
eukprot:scaffold12478_cov19-Tisochrysis_lutea.AAC.1